MTKKQENNKKSDRPRRISYFDEKKKANPSASASSQQQQPRVGRLIDVDDFDRPRVGRIIDVDDFDRHRHETTNKETTTVEKNSNMRTDDENNSNKGFSSRSSHSIDLDTSTSAGGGGPQGGAPVVGAIACRGNPNLKKRLEKKIRTVAPTPTPTPTTQIKRYILQNEEQDSRSDLIDANDTTTTPSNRHRWPSMTSEPGAYPSSGEDDDNNSSQTSFDVDDWQQQQQQPAIDHHHHQQQQQRISDDEINNKSASEVSLVRAHLVLEEEEETRRLDLEEANEVDINAMQKRALKQKDDRYCWLLVYFLVAFCLLVILAAIVATVLSESDDSQAAPEVSESPSAAPSSLLDSFMTRYPNYSNKSKESLDLLTTFPSYTLDSLDDPNSAQSQAFEWLSSHQNLTNLEEWRKIQLFSLVTFYFAFGGPQWPEAIAVNWLNETLDECDWINTDQNLIMYWQQLYLRTTEYDPRPCNDEGQIQTIALFYLQLATAKQPVVIPPELSWLTSLAMLALPFNDIDAPLSDMMPLEVVEMPNLGGFVFSGNKLHGTIPKDIALFTALRNVAFTYNLLTGTIPAVEMAQLPDLKDVQFGDNQLSGNIPSQMGLWTSMTHMDLFLNLFTGSVPPEMAGMIMMESLAIEWNPTITGTLPSGLAVMTRMELFYLWDSSLSGSLPSEFGLMSNMKYLRGNGNSLSGAIPSEMYLMTNMEWLDLSNNRLTGSILPTVGSWSNLETLDLFNNSLTGQIPSEVGLISNLKALLLGNNTFSGAFPPIIWQLTSLRDIDVSDLPLLSGSVPDEICYLQNNETCSYQRQYSDTVDSYECMLNFDCTEILCGCNCLCPTTTGSHEENTTLLSVESSVAKLVDTKPQLRKKQQGG